MRRNALVPSLVTVCALALLGCGKTATPPDSAASSSGSTATSENPSSTNAEASAPAAPAAPNMPVPAPKPIVVEAGTDIVVTADQSVSSKTNNSGDHFDASIAEPVMVGNRIAIPKGAKATGTVVDAKSAGRFKGNAAISVELSSVTVKGQEYRLKTSEITQSGKGRGTRTAETTGGGAAVGAIIGAIAGHGKGAAIGAAAGAGAGAAGGALTGERDITINPETKLTFKLRNALEITRK
jgi:hypothetical protein